MFKKKYKCVIKDIFSNTCHVVRVKAYNVIHARYIAEYLAWTDLPADGFTIDILKGWK